MSQKVLVAGTGISGIAAAKLLLAQGGEVVLYDSNQALSEEKLRSKFDKDANLSVILGPLKKTDLAGIELCIISPGIPLDAPFVAVLDEAKIPIWSEIELAYHCSRGKLAAITGTNGKTTTVSMIESVLNEEGIKAKACGNIGTPMIECRNLKNDEIAVAEISSFQMETLSSLCPHIAVVLNITEDHLNRHYSMENYVFLKAKLLKNLTESEYAVLNFDDPIVRGFAQKTKAKIVWFSVQERVQGAYYENGDLYYLGEKILSACDLLAEGVHNIQNALATVAVGKLLGVNTQTLARALVSFKGIKHRIEIVDEIDGVVFVDDSKGTNVDATIKATLAMKRETVLLLGGKNKGYDYGKLFSAIKKTKVIHTVLYGENRYALLKSAREQGFESFSLCDRFEFAVRVAALIAKRGQVVLLSPASASFDEFTSYEERGERFVEIVRSLQNNTSIIASEEDAE